MGAFYYQVMSFDLINAGIIYQSAMTIIFKKMLGEMVECYVDDLLVKSCQRIDHLELLKVLFDKLR